MSRALDHLQHASQLVTYRVASYAGRSELRYLGEKDHTGPEHDIREPSRDGYRGCPDEVHAHCSCGLIVTPPITTIGAWLDALAADAADLEAARAAEAAQAATALGRPD